MLFHCSDGFQIELDKNVVKTPAGNSLVVPSKQLAMAIAVEWNSQQEVIKPEAMHLVRIQTLSAICPASLSQFHQLIQDSEHTCMYASKIFWQRL